MRTFLIALLLISAAARASVDEALDALHKSGVGLTSLAADVSLKSTRGDLGDDSTKFGTFAMRRLPDGDTQVYANFTKTQSGNRTTHERREYLLAGTDLVDRDYASSKETVRQVRKPGEKVDLFKLGEGPFPLPIGQARADVLKAFDVTEEKNTDPAALALIRLKPKQGTKLAAKFAWITVLVDRATGLPRVVSTANVEEVDHDTATFSNLKLNAAVGVVALTLPPLPDPSAWTRVSK